MSDDFEFKWPGGKYHMSNDFEFKWLGGKYHQKGGEGSGHHGHAGRPGSVGGSAPGGTMGTPQASQQLDKLMALYQKKYEVRGWPQEKEVSKQIKEIGAIKAPGYGEWQKTGEYQNYSHPEHPEYGLVGISYAGRLHAQRSPASASVEFTIPGQVGNARIWVGENSRKAAENFLKKHWGIVR